MLVNIPFQKYNRYKLFEKLFIRVYVTMGVWNLDRKHLQYKFKTFQTETVCKGTKGFLNRVKAFHWLTLAFNAGCNS